MPGLEDSRLVRMMAAATAHLHDHPHVAEVRQTGMILAIELVKDKAHRVPYPWQERRRRIVYVHGLSRGVLWRPFGDVIHFMLPYVITETRSGSWSRSPPRASSAPPPNRFIHEP